MKKSLILSKLTYLLVFFLISNLSIDAQVTVDQNKNVLVGDGSPTSGYKFTVNGNTDIIGLIRSKEFYTVNSNGTISLREKTLPNTTFTYQELHIRPSFGKSGLITFTEDAVADRWTIGTLPGLSKLVFSQGNPTSINDHFVVDRENGKTSISLDNNVSLNSDRLFKFTGGTGIIQFGNGSGSTNFKILSNLSQDIFTVIDNGRVHVDGKLGVNAFNSYSSAFTVGGNVRVQGTQPESDLGAEIAGSFVVAHQNLPNQSPSTRLFFGNGTGYHMHFSKRINSGTTDLITISDGGNMYVTGRLGIGTNNPSFKVDIHDNGGTGTDVANGTWVRINNIDDGHSNIGLATQGLIMSSIKGVKTNTNNFNGFGTGNLQLNAFNGINSPGRMTLTSEGKVSIGYANPDNILHIGLPAAVHSNLGIEIKSPNNEYGGGGLTHSYISGIQELSLKGRTDGTKISSMITLRTEGWNGGGSPGSISFYTSFAGSAVPIERMKITKEGDVYLNNATNGIIMKSPNGTCFKITINDNGTIVPTQLANCPN
jgi:hypothetical protein